MSMMTGCGKRCRNVALIGFAIALNGLGVSCSKNFEEPSSGQGEGTSRAAAPPPRAPASAGPESVHFDAPTGWVEEQPSSGMRLAQYRLPHAEGDGEDGEFVVFHFPGQGGSIEANVTRWLGQMSLPDGSPIPREQAISHKQVRGRDVTLVDASGTYAASMGPRMQGAKKPGYRMLAAIVDTNQGPWFFKLTGPEKTVEKWHSSWLEFVETLRVE